MNKLTSLSHTQGLKFAQENEAHHLILTFCLQPQGCFKQLLYMCRATSTQPLHWPPRMGRMHLELTQLGAELRQALRAPAAVTFLPLLRWVERR